MGIFNGGSGPQLNNLNATGFGGGFSSFNNIFGNFGGATNALGGGIGNIAGGIGGILTSNPIFLIAGAVVLLVVLK